MTNEEVAKKILSYKTIIETKTKERDILKGKIEAKTEELRAHNFDSVEAAQTWLAAEQKSLAKAQAELLADIIEFETVNKQYLEPSNDAD